MKLARLISITVLATAITGCTLQISEFELNPTQVQPTVTTPSPIPAFREVTVTPSAITIIGEVRDSQGLQTGNIEYTFDEIDCNTFLETSWGKGKGEFGYNPDDVNWFVGGRGPYRIESDEEGNLYVPDQVNNRILRYDRQKNIEQIDLPENYIRRGLGDGTYYQGWRHVTIYKDRIFLIFHESHLAVISTNGDHHMEFSLDSLGIQNVAFYHPYPIMADNKGGLYVTDDKEYDIFYLDNEFHPKQVLFEGVSNTFFEFDKLLVGWDGGLYTYNSGVNTVTSWDVSEFEQYVPKEVLIIDIHSIENEFDTINGQTIRLFLGVDNEGRQYFQLIDQQDQNYILRVSLDDHRGFLGEINHNSLLFTLTPDGKLYGLAYNEEDQSVNPQILECSFRTN